jgi:hypothetical protein
MRIETDAVFVHEGLGFDADDLDTAVKPVFDFDVVVGCISNFAVKPVLLIAVVWSKPG